MYEDAELCVLVPLGNLIRRERLPIRPKWTIVCLAVDMFENCSASYIEFCARVLPDLIDVSGNVRSCWTGCCELGLRIDWGKRTPGDPDRPGENP